MDHWFFKWWWWSMSVLELGTNFRKICFSQNVWKIFPRTITTLWSLLCNLSHDYLWVRLTPIFLISIILNWLHRHSHIAFNDHYLIETNWGKIAIIYQTDLFHNFVCTLAIAIFLPVAGYMKQIGLVGNGNLTLGT